MILNLTLTPKCFLSPVEHRIGRPVLVSNVFGMNGNHTDTIRRQEVNGQYNGHKNKQVMIKDTGNTKLIHM